ncbi:carbamoyltransferase N-terminal domain-containing protein [Synechococcus sp. A15-24]|uniref:carbamoyltransferase family protein n=1 Tax=Synechococcus sp. A15-24 TaxID=1050635 RepID=UPI00164969BB|nr:carbamoyltransferase N-terminal domain-containing protein [Synechococcus sp. A15-24]QNJ27815.1 carbamoyltransferase family protein [Synechococcus sp. A15-24]
MKSLGISFGYHDSAVALVVDGEIVSAIQEERFSRIKNDHSFPFGCLTHIFNTYSVNINSIDKIVYYEDPFLKNKRQIKSLLNTTVSGRFPQATSVKKVVSESLTLNSFVFDEFVRCGFASSEFEKYHLKNILSYSEHHLSHAASAYLPSPFHESAVLCMDGVGEDLTTSIWLGSQGKLKLLDSVSYPNSLGLFYSTFTSYLGFKVNEGEYKLMGLAPYGQPKYTQLILENMIKLSDDGKFFLNKRYFSFDYSQIMYTKDFEVLFGFPPINLNDQKFSQDHFDLARSVQEVITLGIMGLVKNVKKLTQAENLCLSGGVALNCVANGNILKSRLFKNIWIQPASGDAGSALGAALLGSEDLDYSKKSSSKDLMKSALLGPSYSNEEIVRFLDEFNINFKKLPESEHLLYLVNSIIDGKVIGFFAGPMEFGPRALGSRSIIADPRIKNMQSILNQKIKFREGFRPFAPVFLESHVRNYFDNVACSPYMLLVDKLKSEHLTNQSVLQEAKGLDKLKVCKSNLPATTHVDCTSRIQTVSSDYGNPQFYSLLKYFHHVTGCPALINTSFNVKDEPIVMTPLDAYNCFMKTGMDILVLDNFVIEKS